MNVSWPASPVSPPVILRQARAGSKADEDAPCSQSFKIPKRLHRQAACSVHAWEGAANQRLRLAASRCGRREARHQQRQGHPRGHLAGAATRREPEQQTSPWAGWASGVPHGNERAFAKPCLKETRQQRINSLWKSVCPRTEVGQPLKSTSPFCSLNVPRRRNCWKAALRTCITCDLGGLIRFFRFASSPCSTAATL